MRLPYDTRAHVIATHMHPFGEYLELRDLTTGESVYRSDITQMKGQIGLERVTIYSSEEGIPLYKDHEYELVSVYNNTSVVDQDAMAGMSLYLHGKDVYDFMLRKN
jgi:hypothetical protein